MTQFQPPADIRLGIARGISYGMFGPTEQILAPMRELGAGLARVYVYWSQVEPRPGALRLDGRGRLLAQLSDEEELWLTVCSSSSWGTRTPTDFLPPSPALDAGAYRRFVSALVARCRGRVRYWQCDNEPSNVGLLWAGTAGEYAAQLAVFHDAVKASDPSAAVVLGGCGYDALSSPPDGPARAFFDEVLAVAGASFDLFDVHLYDHPARIPVHIATVRDMMRRHGCERPVVVGEYNGPTLFELPELDGVLQETMATAFAGGDDLALSTGELVASAAVETPERRALKMLYAAIDTLPPALQMFMAGCPPELDALRDRINCREIVSRNLFALSEGVRRTVCWHLAPEVGDYEDPFTMMELMHGKLPLMAYEDGRLARRRPPADSFRRLVAHLTGADSVTRVGDDGSPEICAFVVNRPERGALTVVWKDGDLVSGEQEAPVTLEWPWPGDTVVANNALGERVTVSLEGGRVRLDASVTPTFLESA